MQCSTLVSSQVVVFTMSCPCGPAGQMYQSQPGWGRVKPEPWSRQRFIDSIRVLSLSMGCKMLLLSKVAGECDDVNYVEQ